MTLPAEVREKERRVFGRTVTRRFPYYGIWRLWWPSFALPLWRVLFCRRRIHLFDECTSSTGTWYLSCDACDLMVHIASVEGTYVDDAKICPIDDDPKWRQIDEREAK